MSEAGVSTYKRKLPPLAVRCWIGIVAGIAKPAIWCLERLGLTCRVVESLTARAPQRIAARSPFRRYVPTTHDVFVATYIKSGTNWMMQIAHQLAWHGKADFEHIHCVVPWPDTTALSGPMRKYAVPLDD